eukprot:3371340-Rhodomonas_salina.1
MKWARKAASERERELMESDESLPLASCCTGNAPMLAAASTGRKERRLGRRVSRGGGGEGRKGEREGGRKTQTLDLP